MKLLRKILIGLVGLVAVSWVGLVIYAYWPTGIDEVPARELARPGDRFIDVDGLQLRYRDAGQSAPGDPTFLLIHGFGNSLQSFRLLAPLLAAHYRVVTVDMPGFGLSDKPVDWDYHNANQAHTMVDFIHRLGLRNVVVGGHSLGGAIALRVALGAPEISGLVLMNPGIINTGVPKIAEYSIFPLPRLSARQFGNRAFREAFLKRSFVNKSVVTDEVMDNLMRAVHSKGYMAGTTRMMSQYEAATEEPLLKQVRVPVLIAWGDRDHNKSLQELRQLQAGLVNSPEVRTARIATAGHYVHEEAPAEVAAAMLEAVPMWRRG